jgi:riboflavin kinase/FMN adenylyltransferase
VVARSEPTLLNLEAETFIDAIIRDRFHPTHIVEGPSFGFGKGRRGNADLLRQRAASFGCEVHIVDPVRLTLDDGRHVMVTSSLIRELLVAGHVRRAAMCLGRNYALAGRVVAGDRRGRQLGFPTANLSDIEQLIPMEGVYAGLADSTGRRYAAAVSIGRSPTFDGDRVRVEAHLLDFTGDLYDQTIRIELVRFLRHQKTFASPEALTAQLHLDVQASRDEEPERRSGARRLEGVNG